MVKNLCDKVSKIKNLSWQFCWIFCWLLRGENYVAKETTEFDGVDDDTATCENEHVCDKCGFQGKTEAGLKIHNTAKHRGFRKVTRKNVEK